MFLTDISIICIHPRIVVFIHTYLIQYTSELLSQYAMNVIARVLICILVYFFKQT